MSKAIFIQNVAHLRAEPSLHSELVSQAIMGDSAEILDTREDWSFVRTEDGYEAWTLGWLLALDHQSNTIEETHRVTLPIVDVYGRSGDWIADKLAFGTPVQVNDEWEGKAETLLCNFDTRSLPSRALTPVSELEAFDASHAARLACQFIGTPYLWGGGTSFGFDCSGFVQRLYAFFGVRLPRNANQQAVSPLGSSVDPEEAWMPGDLLFFTSQSDPFNRGITHVGMALDANRFIHASSLLGVSITARTHPDYFSRLHSAWRLNSNE